MKATTFKAAVLAGSLGLLAGSASGQGLSDPVGYFTKTFQDSSDTSLAVGLLRPEFGSVTITTAADPLVNINETLTAAELAFSAGVQTNSYYLLVTSGPKLGAWYPISTNGASNLTVDLLGDTIGADLDGQSGKIIPFWSLNTLFPGGAGFVKSTAIPANGTRVFFNDLTSAGINLPRSEQYIYLDGTAAAGNPAFDGFYDPTNINPAAKVGDTILIAPDEHLIIRHPSGSGDTSLTVTGDVLVDSVRVMVDHGGDPAGQDIAVGVPYPVDITLNALGLAAVPQTSAFTNTTAIPANGDRLFVYDDVAAGQNKPFATNYIHLDGAALGNPAFTNWYDPTNIGPGNELGDTPGLAKANTGLLIRKVPGAASAGDWIFTSPYTP